MCRLLWLFFLFPILAIAQNPLHEDRYVDSLQAITKQQEAGDSSRALANFQLSGYFSQLDQKKAKTYLKEARQLARSSAFLTAGIPFYESLLLAEDDPSCLVLYRKADSLLSRFHTKDAYLFRSKVWLNYASVLQLQDKQKEMVNTMIEKAIPLAKKGENGTLLAYMHSDLAIALANIGRYEESRRYFLLAIDGLKRATNNSSRIASVYINAAFTYCHVNDLKQAGKMLNEAQQRLKDSPKSLTWPEYYAVESFYLNRSDKYHEALRSAKTGMVMAKELKIGYLLHSLLLQQLVSYHKLKDHKAAENVFRLLQQDATFLAIADARKTAYQLMAEVYAERNQHAKAFQWMARYSEMSDSIANSNLNQEISEMEMRYRNQENLHHINTLKAQKAEVEFQSKNNRLLIVLLAVLILFVLMLLFFILMNLRKNRRLAAQEKVSYQYQLKEMAQQKQLQVSSALIEGEERERTRMARDLHDGLGSGLAAVKLHVSALSQQRDVASVQTATLAIADQLDASLTELRRIARNLMPETLIKFGLEKALSDLCLSAAQPPLNIEFQALGMEQVLPEKTQIMIYRIVQELLNNAIRHADASAIFIQCSQSDSILLITAEDNGKGFDIDAAQHHAGMGLESIRTRVAYLNGKIEMQSTIGEGTVINIELDV